MIKTQLTDGYGSGSRVKITSGGQLITAPFDYDQTEFKELAEPDTAYNFYAPKAGQQFVITGIFYRADQQVSNTAGATLVIYEATTAATTTVSKVLHQDDVIRNDRFNARVNILVNEGKFVNAKTTDDDVHMTIIGYYIPRIS